MRVLTAILMIASLTIWACNGGSEDEDGRIPTETVRNPVSADGTADDVPMPVLSFERTEHDFGRLSEGERVEYSFRFTNTGNADLVIASSYGSCGCTVPDWPKEAVAPGGQGAIKVSFDSKGRPGVNNKTITVIANTQPRTTVLKISAEVERNQ